MLRLLPPTTLTRCITLSALTVLRSGALSSLAFRTFAATPALLKPSKSVALRRKAPDKAQRSSPKGRGATGQPKKRSSERCVNDDKGHGTSRAKVKASSPVGRGGAAAKPRSKRGSHSPRATSPPLHNTVANREVTSDSHPDKVGLTTAATSPPGRESLSQFVARRAAEREATTQVTSGRRAVRLATPREAEKSRIAMRHLMQHFFVTQRAERSRKLNSEPVPLLSPADEARLAHPMLRSISRNDTAAAAPSAFEQPPSVGAADTPPPVAETNPLR